MIQILNQLDADGLLVKLFKSGLITHKYMFYRDIYLRYEKYKNEGKKILDAEFLTAKDFKISESTVQRAIRKMKS